MSWQAGLGSRNNLSLPQFSVKYSSAEQVSHTEGWRTSAAGFTAALSSSSSSVLSSSSSKTAASESNDLTGTDSSSQSDSINPVPLQDVSELALPRPAGSQLRGVPEEK